jgi:hypothetical protein
MNKVRNAPLTLALLLTTLLAVAGCSVPVSASNGTSTPVSEAPASPVAAPAHTTTPSPTPTPNTSIGKFGEAKEWADHLSVTVKPVGPGTISSSGIGAKASGGALYMFDVTVTNGTADVYNPSLFSASVTYGAQGAQADTVFDSAQGIGGTFTGQVLPGKSQTVRMAYGIPATGLGDVTLSLTPDFSHKAVVYNGPVQ